MIQEIEILVIRVNMIKIFKNPSIDFKSLNRRLNHLLTDYDKRLSKRHDNIHRLAHYFKASDEVFDSLPENASIGDLKTLLHKKFIVNDMPPVKKFLKELDQIND